ncbi:MAG: glycosyltransferase [Solirubrobacterales bacterium]
MTRVRGESPQAIALDSLPFFDLQYEELDSDAARLLDVSTARAYGAVVLAADENEAVVAFARPTERGLETVAAMLGRDIEPVSAGAGAIASAQRWVYGARAPRAPRRGRHFEGRPEEASDRLEVVAGRTGLPIFSLDRWTRPDGRLIDPIDGEAAAIFGYDLCHALGVLPLEADGRIITVATSDPEDPIVQRVVRTVTGREPRWVIAPEDELMRAIGRTFHRQSMPWVQLALGTDAAPAPAEVSEPAVTEPNLDEAAEALAVEPDAPAEVGFDAPSRHRHLGELLLERGLVTANEIDDALEIQERTGDRMGQILMHVSGLSDDAIASALAEQSRLTEVDLDTIRPEQRAVALLPEGVIRRFQVVPLEVVGETLVIAMVDKEDQNALAAIREHTSMPLRIMLAPASAIDRLLHRVYGDQYVRNAVHELVETAPQESAHFVLSRGQKVAIALFALALTVGGLLQPIATIVAISIFAVSFYLAFGLYRFWLVYRSLEHDLHLPITDTDVAEINERTLPVYTILVPLYKEASVIPHLVASIQRLDYPPTKLDVKLLLEEDDLESIAAIESISLPPQFQALVVPHAHPKTKPKACNYGLPHARGEMVVIFDAEDEPEPDQLKKVVASLRNANDPKIICVQARLNYYNPNQNLLTRWFTTEYSMWFDLFLPGLDATNVPIPLGGTSNHFVREKLDELGGWDPFNVTEDADLGIRLYKHGYRVAVVDSTTYEEATSEVRNWVRQRSRWVKGYIQTWLVQMRHPIILMREIGLRRWLSFQLVVGGTFLVFLLNPVFWGLTSLWTLTEAGLLREIFPGVVYYAGGFALYLGNFLFAYVTAAGSAYRGYNHLVKYALLIPLYWALMSVAAWKGLIQLIRKPFYWEKTEHGLYVREESWEDRPKRAG